MTSKKPRKPPKLFNSGPEWAWVSAQWWRVQLPGYVCDISRWFTDEQWKAEFALVGGVAEKEEYFDSQLAAIAWLREQVIARHEETAAIIGGGLPVPVKAGAR